MAFGLQIKNPGSELVLTADAFTPVYLGRATLVSTVQPIAVGSAASGTGTGGASTLTFNYAGQIIPVLALPAGFKGTIYSCTQSGSTWTIAVDYTDGTLISDVNSPAFAMSVQSAPTVFVFGFAVTSGSGFGLQLFNGSGQLVVDLTRRPLMIRQRVSLPASTPSTTIAAMTLPGILGRATDSRFIGGPTGVPEIRRYATSISIFGIVGGTTFQRSFDRRRLANGPADDPDIPARLDSCDLWLVECSSLP